MTPLRQQMIDAMQVRGFSVRTHQSYLRAVSNFARYFQRSPEQLGVDEIQLYFVYLAKERGLSGASCRVSLNALRFLYLQVLKWPSFDVAIAIPKKAQRIPELLTRGEVDVLLAACANDKHRMMLMTCYGCGLRVSELVALKVRHIDGERRLVRVEQGKGAKDRSVILSVTLLQQLRLYWQQYRPREWLFPNSYQPTQPMSISSAQKVFTAAKRRAGLSKVGGIHSLRHAYATHQLEGGLAVHQLQALLGHRRLSSTLRYVHWVPNYREGLVNNADLLDALAVSHG